MNMFKFEFKRLLKPGVIWSISCGLLVVLFMSFFPSMKELGMQELVFSKMEAMPSAILEAFNISGAMDFSKISDYIAYVIQYIFMAAGVYGAILGVSALIKEESEGTIEFLYSKPVKRREIITSKLFASISIFLIFIVIGAIMTTIASILVKPSDIETISLITDIKKTFIGMAFVGYIFMAIGFLISVFIKSAKQATPIALAVFFTTYIFGIIGKLKEGLSVFLYLSPFDYAAPAKIISEGFQIKYIILGVIIMTISISGTYLVYTKKDFR